MLEQAGASHVARSMYIDALNNTISAESSPHYHHLVSHAMISRGLLLSALVGYAAQSVAAQIGKVITKYIREQRNRSSTDLLL